jgi:glycosyltransferase involved in cell wall biosynthesis
MNSHPKNLWIFLCKGKPTRGGGGLGVAYNYLRSIHGSTPAPPEICSYVICGRHLAKLPDDSGRSFDDFLNSIPTDKCNRLIMFIQQAFMIARLAKKYRKTVILGFSPYYLWNFLRLLVPENTVFVHSEHGKGGRHNELAQERGRFGFREKIIEQLVSWNFYHSHHVIFPSAGSVELFLEMNPRLLAITRTKSAVIHNGVEFTSEHQPPIKIERLQIVSIAHHVREKGLDDVLACLGDTRLNKIAWHFENFGAKSQLTESLEAIVARMGISDAVKFSGQQPVNTVKAALASASIFLHLPKIVVFDLSLLEAMMSGIPVITRPLPGNVEALGENYPLYVKTPTEAAEKIVWIANNPDQARKIGTLLRHRAIELYTNEAMAERYRAYLLSLM